MSKQYEKKSVCLFEKVVNNHFGMIILAIVFCFASVGFAEEQKSPLVQIKNFSNAHVKSSRNKLDTNISSSKKSPTRFYIQCHKIMKENVSIDDSGNIVLDLSQWKPQGKDKSKTLRFRFINKKDIEPLKNKDVTISLDISSEGKNANAKLFGEGRANGKHYYFYQKVEITKDGGTINASKLLPENLENFWVRLDFMTPAKYIISNISLSKK